MSNIKPGMYSVRLKWYTNNDELEVAYANTNVQNYKELQEEIAYIKKTFARNAKNLDDIEVTYQLVKLRDATLSYDEYDDYLGLQDNSDLKFILDI